MQKIAELLKGRAFLTLATASPAAQPNAVPKFILKFEAPNLYLIDYSIARTAENLRANPRASIALMDLDNLEGYRANGSVKLIEKGVEFDALAKELDKKLVKLSTDRVIDAMKTGKKNDHFELEIPDRFIVIKLTIEDVVKIGPQGDLFREPEGATPSKP